MGAAASANVTPALACVETARRVLTLGFPTPSSALVAPAARRGECPSQRHPLAAGFALDTSECRSTSARSAKCTNVLHSARAFMTHWPLYRR
jgi:hypothetical protein